VSLHFEDDANVVLKICDAELVVDLFEDLQTLARKASACSSWP
jgi:hypothetical protein